jgi:RNA polymerase sigma factor (sigma-70 family)
MESGHGEKTSETLLRRIGQDQSDDAAWQAFVACYGPKINGWCMRRGLQEADAEDVTQNVLLRLARALKTFTYDPSKRFRSWLRLVTERALSDFFLDRKRRPSAGIGGDHVLTALETVQARDELMEQLNQEFIEAMVSQACKIVCARVQPQTWEAFLLTACDGHPGEEVAKRLGMNLTAVFKAKSRVLALIRKEVEKLDGQP